MTLNAIATQHKFIWPSADICSHWQVFISLLSLFVQKKCLFCVRCKNTINRQRLDCHLFLVQQITAMHIWGLQKLPKGTSIFWHCNTYIVIVGILFCEKNKLKFSNSSCSSYRSTKTDEVTSNVLRIFSFSGRFHQHVYAQLLRGQIPKAQKAACLDCLFCAIRIFVCKSCF